MNPGFKAIFIPVNNSQESNVHISLFSRAQIDTEVNIHHYIEFIYDRSTIHLPLYQLSTHPRRYVEQGLLRLVWELRSGESGSKSKAWHKTFNFGFYFFSTMNYSLILSINLDYRIINSFSQGPSQRQSQKKNMFVFDFSTPCAIFFPEEVLQAKCHFKNIYIIIFYLDIPTLFIRLPPNVFFSSDVSIAT